MAWFSVPILTLILLSLSPNPTLSISIPFPNPNFPPKTQDSLFGDAHFIGNSTAVQLNRPTPPSFGIIFPNPPFNFTSSMSLSSHFTFEIGNGIALVIVPVDFPSKFSKIMSFEVLNANRFLGIEFHANVCEISSSRVSKVSKVSNLLKDGVKLSAWIDYRAGLKRLDVRLSELGDSISKPVEPLISYRIDLGEVLRGEEVLLGLASFNEKNEQKQIASVYSWSSEIKDAPKWMHSIPVNPQEERLTVRDSEKKDGFVSGFVFATGCGAMAALVMFFVWSYVVDSRKVQGESLACPSEFKYEKIDVLAVKNLETGMK